MITQRKYFLYQGLRLSYLDSCTKNLDTIPIVIAHANGYSGGCYKYYLEHLQSKARVFAIDFSGHGQSQTTMDFQDWYFFRDQLLALIKHEQLPQAIVIGHSLGGASGILAAYKNPDVIQKVIALDPVLLDPAQLLLSSWFNPQASKADTRKASFRDKEQVRRVFQKFPVFRNWHPQIFDDYLTTCFRQNPDSSNQSIALACDPQLEAKIFRSPSIKSYLDFILVNSQVHILTMRDSSVCPWISAQLVACSNAHSSVHYFDNKTHFFPFEEPAWTLEQIERFL